MDLSWIAAVLAPRDVAAHPDLPDDDFDSRESAQLAALVMGRFPLIGGRRRFTQHDSPLLYAAFRAIADDSVRGGVRDLCELLAGTDETDAARATAYTLILCSAAAELDDFDVGFEALNRLLERTRPASADESLVRAVLLQQRALRKFDAGLPHLGDSAEAGRILSTIRAKHVSAFALGPNSRRKSRDMIDTILDNLMDAVASLVPSDAPERADMPFLPKWQDRVRRTETELTARVSRIRAENYSAALENTFRDQFDQHPRSIGGRKHTDLYFPTLALELAGDGTVFAARRDLALQRLVRDAGATANTADDVRLLRHAGAKNELPLVLRRLYDAGPLDALEQDAHQILRRRLRPHLLRTVELQVLQAAADLFTPEAARKALDAVMSALRFGDPPNLPRRWELPILRRAAGWSAAAALSNVCDAASEVAEYLLSAVPSMEDAPQLADRSLRRALEELQWDGVRRDIRKRWLSLLPDIAGKLPGTASLISRKEGVRVSSTDDRSPLLRLADELNFAITTSHPDSRFDESDLKVVSAALLKVRTHAARGMTVRSIDPADIAAALIETAGATSLWRVLAGFLLDPKVAKEDRTPAFNRLAAADIVVPDDIATLLREGIADVLTISSASGSGRPVRPYPAAFRFAAVHGILDEDDIYDGIAQLAGGSDVIARRESAATAALLARKQGFGWLLPMMLPLVGDENVEVRAHAARAMVLLSGTAYQVVERRTAELLNADGAVIPAVVLDALKQTSWWARGPVARLVADLAEHHPLRPIRVAAAALLGGEPGIE